MEEGGTSRLEGGACKPPRKEREYGHHRYSVPAGRPGAVPLWYADDQLRSGGGGGRKDEDPAGAPDGQPVYGRSGGRSHHGGHPVLLRHHRYGGGLCQRRHDDAEPGRLDHHGCQHRHHHHRYAHRPGRGGPGSPVRLCGRGAHGLCKGYENAAHRPDSGRSGRAVHRHGHDERRHVPPAGLPGVCGTGLHLL